MLTPNGPSTEEFTSAFAASAQEFAERFFRQMTAGSCEANDHWRGEACAALWVAVQAVFDVSVLSPYERAELLRAITKKMLPFWQKHCARRGDISRMLARHPVQYGQRCSPGNLIRTADSIVAELLGGSGLSREATVPAQRVLSEDLVHHMFDDLHRIEDFKRRSERYRPGHSTTRALARRPAAKV
jgi:hypothetical protein